jgi:hypothetical protein
MWMRDTIGEAWAVNTFTAQDRHPYPWREMNRQDYSDSLSTATASSELWSDAGSIRP